jgi:hypothetical protein
VRRAPQASPKLAALNYLKDLALVISQRIASSKILALLIFQVKTKQPASFI